MTLDELRRIVDSVALFEPIDDCMWVSPEDWQTLLDRFSLPSSVDPAAKFSGVSIFVDDALKRGDFETGTYKWDDGVVHKVVRHRHIMYDEQGNRT